MEQYNLTVVIPTFNRGSKILNTLESLSNQSISSFEVVVVNDGSTDNTSSILNTIEKNYPFQLTIVEQVNMGRAGSRNSGFDNAKAELIVSIDDDVRLDKYCLEEHYKHHQRFPGSILVGEVKEDPTLAKTDIQRFLIYQRRLWLQVLESASNPLKQNEIYITAANFSIPKELFRKMGGFDSRLKAVIDYDLAIRCTEVGIPIYYSNKAIVWHDDFITCRSFINRRRQSVKNEELLKRLKPELIDKYHLYKEPPISRFKAFLYSFLAHRFFVSTIDNFNFYRFVLPRTVRYRFYAAVIMGLGKHFRHRSF